MKFLNLLIVISFFYNFGGSSSSSCGKLHDITYPYYLPGTCKTIELQCVGNDTLLYTGDTKYVVQDMSADNMTLTLVDPDLAVGGCHVPNQKQTYFGEENPFSFVDIASEVYFFNCTDEVEDPNYKLIHCIDVPGSRIYAGLDISDIGSIHKSCRYVGNTLADYEVKMRWNNTDGVEMMEMLRQGFVMSWNIPDYYSFAGFYSFEAAGYDNKRCSVLQHCWRNTISDFKYTMRENYSTTGRSKLIVFLSLQSTFLICIHQPRKYGTYTSSQVIYGFSLTLVVLLDILLVILGIRLTLLPLGIFLFLLHKYKRISLSINYVEKFLRKHEMLSVRRYDFIEIAIMTNHFREKLGQGGFGSVYKGKLFSGGEVAVKILTNSLGDGDDFMSEVATIGSIHHANIVRLIGFCSEGSKRALVYSYMPKGSLDKYIFSSRNNSFSVEKRREIAPGIARGIDYLHRGCQMQILHFDIKPHNILLDHDLTPKVADFGLAKLYSREYNLVTLSMARGTRGYIAPELISRAFGVISYKADVYSFGMLLMEMASGRRNVNNHAESSSQVYYPSWIYDQLKLADETHNYNLHNSVAQFGEIEGILYKVALWCIQMNPSNRPSMSRVIEMLQSDADSLEMPPRPFTTSSPEEVTLRCSQIDSCSIELSEISEEISLL